MTRAVTGTEVRLTVRDRSPGAVCTQGAEVVATPQVAGREPVIGKIGETSALTLSGSESWKIRSVRNGCWSTTVTWLETDAPVVTLETFASATIRGKFGKSDAAAPRALNGSIVRVTDPAATPLAAEPEPVACTLEFPEWKCEIPAQLPVDLRLDGSGFAPVYIWNITTKPGEIRGVGEQQLVAGSSLAG